MVVESAEAPLFSSVGCGRVVRCRWQPLVTGFPSIEPARSFDRQFDTDRGSAIGIVERPNEAPLPLQCQLCQR